MEGKETKEDEEEKGPTETRTKRFLPLGAVSRIPQMKLPGSDGQDLVTVSFPSSSHPTSLVPLPDIYTTCPELRNFPKISISELDDFLKDGKNKEKRGFDPEKLTVKPYVFCVALRNAFS